MVLIVQRFFLLGKGVTVHCRNKAFVELGSMDTFSQAVVCIFIFLTVSREQNF